MTKYDLDIKDYEIFNSLYQHPLSSYVEVSEQVGLAPGTVRDRINNMKKYEFIQPDGIYNDPILGPRETSEVEVRYSPQKIGLHRQHVIFSNVTSEKSYVKLVKFCDEHPYTHFRSDLYGAGRSLYIQFNIPKEIDPIMQSTFDEIQDNLGIQSSIVKEIKQDVGNPNIRRYDRYNGVWMGDEKKSLLIKSIFDECQAIEIPEDSFQIYNMSNLDAILLRELKINAKASITRLAEYHDVNKSTISRRIKNLKENVIERGVLVFDWEVFGLNSYSLITGKFKDDLDYFKMQNFVHSRDLPINLQISTDEDLNYTIYSVGNSIHLLDMKRILWNISDTEKFNSFQMDQREFKSYHFYHENYDEKSNWITNHEYVKDIPLSVLKE